MKGSLKGYGLLVFWGGTSFLKNERLIIVTFLTKKKKKIFPTIINVQPFLGGGCLKKMCLALKVKKVHTTDSIYI